MNCNKKHSSFGECFFFTHILRNFIGNHIGDTMEKQDLVYMLRCRDGSLYTGWTNDIEKRLLAHKSGKGGKYTRSRLPLELVYKELCANKQDAMRREYAIKRLNHEEKEKLILSKSNALRKEESDQES